MITSVCTCTILRGKQLATNFDQPEAPVPEGRMWRFEQTSCWVCVKVRAIGDPSYCKARYRTPWYVQGNRQQAILGLYTLHWSASRRAVLPTYADILQVGV